jgi:cell division protein FtsB
MKQARQIWNTMRTAFAPTFAFIVVSFFLGSALFGANGLLAGVEYRQQLEVRAKKLAELRQEKAVIANRVALLDPQKANPDLVDELVRRELGLAHPDEVIIPLN